MGDQGNRFTNWDIMLVPDGGRVVNIVAPGVLKTESNKPFRDWLAKNHTVRAMIGLPPQAYESRGTKFHTDEGGAALIVVDKGKIPNAPEPILGQPKSWDEFIELIKPLANGGTHARVEGGKKIGQETEIGKIKPELAQDGRSEGSVTGIEPISESSTDIRKRDGDSTGLQDRTGRVQRGSGGDQGLGRYEPTGLLGRGHDSESVVPEETGIPTRMGDTDERHGQERVHPVDGTTSGLDNETSPGSVLHPSGGGNITQTTKGTGKEKPERSTDNTNAGFIGYVLGQWGGVKHPVSLFEPNGLAMIKEPDYLLII